MNTHMDIYSFMNTDMYAERAKDVALKLTSLIK